VGPLVNLAPLVRSLGCDPGPVFRQSGFSLEEFEDPDHWMPYLRSSRLLANCVDATGCDQLGLLLGQKASPSHLGMAGFLLRAAPNVGEALKAFVENLDLHDEGGVATLDIGPEFTSLGFALHLPGLSATEQICDLSIVMMYKVMRALCGDDWAASTVRLQRTEPEDWEPYRRYFRSTLFFNSTECAISFKSQCLRDTSPSADKLLYKYLTEKAGSLHDIHRSDLLENLPAVMIKGLLTEKSAAHQIADMFGLRERTLHRRLRSAGTSFRHELDQARKLVSEQLLGNTTLPVCDVASALGYADSSGFIRAFKRWNGISPTSWRKQNSPRLKARAG
jgi:AraC-like DNA-binding protein